MSKKQKRKEKLIKKNTKIKYYYQFIENRLDRDTGSVVESIGQ